MTPDNQRRLTEDDEETTDAGPAPDGEPGQPDQGSDPQPPATGDDEVAFEEAIEELETIVEELEEGKLGLEEAMERFERGLHLVKACRGKLQQAELKVEQLLDDGTTDEL